MTASPLGPHAGPVLRSLARLEAGGSSSDVRALPIEDRLVAGLRSVPGPGSVSERVEAVVNDTLERGERLNSLMALSLGARLRSAIAGKLEAAVAPAAQQSAARLLRAALMWDLVYGGHSNPMAVVVELAVQGRYAEVLPGDQLVVWNRGLARPRVLTQLETAHQLP